MFSLYDYVTPERPTPERLARDYNEEAERLEAEAHRLRDVAKKLRQDPAYCQINLGPRSYTYKNPYRARVGDYVVIRLPSSKVEAHRVRALGKGAYCGPVHKSARAVGQLV